MITTLVRYTSTLCALCALLSLAGLSGCATPGATFQYTSALPQSVVFPPPPEVARYEYLGELTGEQNFKSTEGGMAAAGTQFLRWVVGLGSRKQLPQVLQRPQSGVVDAQGRIYVTDVSRQAVYVFDEPGGKFQVWDLAGPDQLFIAPIAITLGPHEELWVTDAELKQVVRLDMTGKPVGAFGEGRLQRPTGIARDAGRGRVYVADSQAGDIKVFNEQGQWLETLGSKGEGPGQFNGPTFLAVIVDKLYVTDTLNARVQVLDAQGLVIQTLGGRGLQIGHTPRPKGVAGGPDGLVYVVESYYDYLLVFNDKGDLLLPIGGSGSGVGHFYLPSGVWSDSRGRVFVADTFNGRVVVLQFLGGSDAADLH